MALYTLYMLNMFQILHKINHPVYTIYKYNSESRTETLFFIITLHVRRYYLLSLTNKEPIFKVPVAAAVSEVLLYNTTGSNEYGNAFFFQLSDQLMDAIY
jgi:hypothetical protein